MSQNGSKLSLSTWLPWSAVAFAIGITATASAFNTFQTEDDAEQQRVHSERRFDRLEDKMDRILEWQRANLPRKAD